MSERPRGHLWTWPQILGGVAVGLLLGSVIAIIVLA